jgi:hypothetical protein
MNLSRSGSACSSVAKASSSLRWRKKHRISEALTPSLVLASTQARCRPLTTVSIATPRAVWVCGSKNIRCAPRCRPARAAGRPRPCRKNPAPSAARWPRVIDVQKALQVGEGIGATQGSSTLAYGMATPLRCASAKISSGSSEPSMCMCSSALGMRCSRPAGGQREREGMNASADSKSDAQFFRWRR